MDQETRVNEVSDLDKRFRKVIPYLLVIGVYAAVAIALWYAFIVYKDISLLKSDPCATCEKFWNMTCIAISRGG